MRLCSAEGLACTDVVVLGVAPSEQVFQPGRALRVGPAYNVCGCISLLDHVFSRLVARAVRDAYIIPVACDHAIDLHVLPGHARRVRPAQKGLDEEAVVVIHRKLQRIGIGRTDHRCPCLADPVAGGIGVPKDVCVAGSDLDGAGKGKQSDGLRGISERCVALGECLKNEETVTSNCNCISERCVPLGECLKNVKL